MRRNARIGYMFSGGSNHQGKKKSWYIMMHKKSNRSLFIVTKISKPEFIQLKVAGGCLLHYTDVGTHQGWGSGGGERKGIALTLLGFVGFGLSS